MPRPAWAGYPVSMRIRIISERKQVQGTIPEAQSFTEMKDDDGRVIDYRGVRFKGYLSTFWNVTPSDRQGDRVLRGAFAETIPRFMRNPILLLNHDNSVGSIGGRFTTVREDDRGLYVEAILSDAPCNRSVRFDVVARHLRALSMAGIFYYEEDGHTISKVELWEGSLVATPANPDCLIVPVL